MALIFIYISNLNLILITKIVKNIFYVSQAPQNFYSTQRTYCLSGLIALSLSFLSALMFRS